MICERCGLDMEVEPKTSEVWVFIQEPAYSHLRLECHNLVHDTWGQEKKCGHVTLVMLSPDGLEHCVQEYGVPHYAENSPDDLVRKYVNQRTPGRLYKAVIDKVGPLRPRHEKLIASMAWELETATVQDIVNALPFSNLKLPLKRVDGAA